MRRWALGALLVLAVGCDGADGGGGGGSTDADSSTPGSDVTSNDVGGSDVAGDASSGADTAGLPGDGSGGDEALCTDSGGSWSAGECTCGGDTIWAAGKGCEDAGGAAGLLCASTGGTWNSVAATCLCPGGTWDETAGCGVDPRTLCETTAGTWDASVALCDCGPGGGFSPVDGCFGASEALCGSTGGTWTLLDCGSFCGDCACPAGTSWAQDSGCVDDSALEACLLACGDGCFSAAQEVCGADGKFGCPCEMACHGIAVAQDPSSCCEPMPSNCVPTCQLNVAMNCTSTTDAHGCPFLDWTDVDCGTSACIVDYETGQAACSEDPGALCASTAGSWADGVCNCGPGGVFDPTVGCHNPDYDPCIESGGTWIPLNCGTWCGECDCPDGQGFTEGVGCQSEDLQACLLACGDGCYSAPQEVCGEDGKFGCPCEMACYGIAAAADPLSCCEPVPPGCVATCAANIATSCTTTLDVHGCPVQSYTTMGCGGMACLTSSPSGSAICVDPCEPMDAAPGSGACDTGWGWKWDGAACAYIGGTCTCDGADCGALYDDESACLAVHGVCQGTPSVGALCSATSGWFTEGACDCGEGGAFDPAFGCFPESALACLDTGGTWAAAFCGPFCGECTCEGDQAFAQGLGCVAIP